MGSIQSAPIIGSNTAMNVEFINPLISSTANVLSTMAMMDTQPGMVTTRPDSIPIGDVTGIINMVSSQAQCIMALSFPEAAILAIFEAMIGEKAETIDNHITDLVGELTNMVTGGAKQILIEKGYDFDMATPKVIVGKSEPISHNNDSSIVIIPFDTDNGSFYVEMCFNKFN